MEPCRTRWAFIALLMLTGTLTVLEGYLLRAPATVNSRTPITIHLPASHSNERFISNRFKTTLSRGNARHCSSNDSTNEDASTSEHIPAVEDPNLHIDSVLGAEVEDIVSIFLSQDASINKETKNRVADVLEISKGAAEEIEKAHKMTVAPHLEMEEGRRQKEGRQQHQPGEGAAAAAAAAAPGTRGGRGALLLRRRGLPLAAGALNAALAAAAALLLAGAGGAPLRPAAWGGLAGCQCLLYGQYAAARGLRLRRRWQRAQSCTAPKPLM